MPDMAYSRAYETYAALDSAFSTKIVANLDTRFFITASLLTVQLKEVNYFLIHLKMILLDIK